MEERRCSSPSHNYDIFRIDIYDESRRLPDVKRLLRKPTNAEVAILRVLWSRGPSTVREVATVMGREGAYTTVLKLMQNMTEKGLVRREESSRTHVYEAVGTEEQTQRQLVTDLLDRVFDGSAAKLVMQALAATKTSPKELAEIRKLLDKQRGGRR
jgi:BlaI family penicillinase repressor